MVIVRNWLPDFYCAFNGFASAVAPHKRDVIPWLLCGTFRHKRDVIPWLLCGRRGHRLNSTRDVQRVQMFNVFRLCEGGEPTWAREKDLNINSSRHLPPKSKCFRFYIYPHSLEDGSIAETCQLPGRGFS